jgi:hypothetical protein
MTQETFQTCPRCGKAIEAGFAHKAPGLSFVAPEKLEHFVFLDEDVAKSALSKLVPSGAAFFRSYLCRSCELYIVDYSTTLDRDQANQVAQAMAPRR